VVGSQFSFSCNYSDAGANDLHWYFSDDSSIENCQAENTYLPSRAKLASIVHLPPYLSFGGAVSHTFNFAGIWTATAYQNGIDPVLSVTIVIIASGGQGSAGPTGGHTTGGDTTVPASPVLIPVTGVDLGLWRGLVTRLFVYAGFALLGFGLMAHARARRELETI
jgi:hypothetical protein